LKLGARGGDLWHGAAEPQPGAARGRTGHLLHRDPGRHRHL